MARWAVLLSALLLAPQALAGAREDCEEWARNDRVSAMLWDRYIERCVESMQGEEPEAPSEDEPVATPPPMIDRAPQQN